MKVLSGRYGYYQLLQKNANIRTHLVETHLFSQASLTKCLEKSNNLLIRPLVGPSCMQVRRFGIDEYEVERKGEKIQCSDLPTLYQVIHENLIDKKQYVVQSFPLEEPIHQRSFYTLHRKTQFANWHVLHKTTSRQGNEIKRYDLFRQWNLMNVLLEIGETLGEAFPRCSTVVVEIVNSETDFLCIDTVVHYRNSKWSQFHSLGNKWFSRSFIPKTELCTKWTVEQFLHKMNDVILKPCIGQQGKGIVKIHVTTSRSYEVQYRNKKTIFHTFEELYRHLERTYLTKNDYLIQQFIHLRTVDQCPYDIRVITQLDRGKWLVTGMLIKVAAPEYFVTNRAQKLLTIDTLHDFSLDRSKKAIEKLCLKASNILEERTAPLGMIGFDVGMDANGKLWILEANYTPALSMFYGLGNNEMYENIHHFIRLKKSNEIE
ncbi:YheC/YheD family protein [Sporosarcina sp. ITBMC105]